MDAEQVALLDGVAASPLLIAKRAARFEERIVG